jgi:adenylate kinase family enzyme
MIINIVGPSGSGKTTLGYKLESKTKYKIIHTDDI